MTFLSLSVVSGRAFGALGDVYTLNGGLYRSDRPVQESLQFGDAKTILQRSSVYIPSSYGKLIGMTPGNDQTVFWFEDDNGAVRNVLVRSDELTLIERKGSASVTKY
jgi:hypothetical protein